MFAQTKTMIRSLLFLPPLQGSPFMCKVLSGRHFQNKPVSLALKISAGWNSLSSVGNLVQSQFEVMSSVTEAASPDIWRNAIRCLALNPSSQPELQANVWCPKDVANSFAFSCNIGPDIGTFKLHACLNHNRRASSTSVCTAVRRLFRSGKKLDNWKASSVFSLFFMMEEIVLLATSNSWAIKDSFTFNCLDYFHFFSQLYWPMTTFQNCHAVQYYYYNCMHHEERSHCQ